jgi:hypothetical protein
VGEQPMKAVAWAAWPLGAAMPSPAAATHPHGSSSYRQHEAPATVKHGGRAGSEACCRDGSRAWATGSGSVAALATGPAGLPAVWLFFASTAFWGAGGSR